MKQRKNIMKKYKDILEIYSLAYNNLFCVEYQIKTWTKFCKDNFELIIVDSNCGEHKENTEKKREICKKYNIEMIELPESVSYKDLHPSSIISYKYDYIYHNIVMKRRPKYFAFMDQDVFPITEVSFTDYIDKFNMYGHCGNLRKNKKWAPAASFHSYKLDFIEKFNPSFKHRQPVDSDDHLNGWFDGFACLWDTYTSKCGVDFLELRKASNPTSHVFNFGGSGKEGDLSRVELGDSKKGNSKGYKRSMLHFICQSKLLHATGSRFLDQMSGPQEGYLKGFLDAVLLASDYSLKANTKFGPYSRLFP